MKLKDINWLLIIIILSGLIFWIGLIVCFTGCAQIIYTDPNGVTVQVNTLLEDVEFDKLKYHELLMQKYQGDSKNIDIKTPYGTLGTTDSNE